ncbi:MAG: gliding motility-associated C-terminal domain-containing protein [Bacteroidota bacterium]
MVKIKLKNFVYTLILLFSSYFGFSQCGGTDNSITICNKETYNQGLGNPTGVVNLFSLLGGAPVAGGTWTDLNSSGGLNITTGLLNTWAINQSGTFNYRYTRVGVPGCVDNTGQITLTLGGFPGVDNLNAVACDNTTAVPLFSFLGSNPNPHFNGTWSGIGLPPGSLTGNFFNAALAGEGVYTLTYTVPAVGICASESANVTLTVHPLPDAGTPTPLVFCETDDFSTFTNVDLFDQLAGEDAGGTWTENSGTTELSGPGDSFINIQNIALLGPGTYTFTYTVNPSHPICTPATANVAITIEPVVDLNGATLAVDPDICFSQIGTTAIIGTITQGVTPIPNGTYNITYVLTGANTGTQTVPVTFAGGTASFTINNAFLLSVGTTTVEITTVVDPSTVLDCTRTISNLTSTFIINENPNVSDSQLVIDDICISETAIGQISDINGPTLELSNGTYTITYSITGPSGTLTGQTSSVTINNGSGSFNISSALTTPAGIYSVTITNVTNTATNCSTVANITDTFEVFPIPDATSISVTIPDICDGENVVVNIAGATTLPNGSYTIDYDLTGAIVAASQTATVNFVGGAASFNIPNGLYVIGVSTLTITNLFNTTTTCETTTFTNPSASFEIHAIPDANDIEISVTDVCLGQSGTVNIFDINPGVAPELTDGSYTITYDLTGANIASNQATTATLTGGTGSFTIPASQLTNVGNTTVNIIIITNVTTGCDAVGVPIITTFEVLPIPIINSVSLTVAQPICQGSGTAATITGASVPDGNYELTYDLTGANTLLNQTVSVLFAGGSTSFPFTNLQIPNIGTYTLSITNIVDNNTPNACTSPVTGVMTTFVVNENPNITNTTIAATTPICLGTNGTVTLTDLTSLLSNGTYTVTYSLSGANTAINETATVTITGGTGSYNIPASLLLNIGTTNVNISLITNQATGCSTIANLNTSFDILPLPDLTGANIFVVEPICLGSDANVLFNSPSLANGTYDISYNITGANTGSGSASLIVVGGNASFLIGAAQIPNVGLNQVTISSFANAITTCSVTVPLITDDFMVNPIPQITSPEITIPNVCLGSDGTVTIASTGGLIDGTYNITYSITGFNGPLTQTDSVIITGGVGTITLPAAILTNLGLTTFSISAITNATTTCSNTFTNVQVNFIVNPLPNVTPSNVTVADTCIDVDANGTISGATNLPNGNYTFTYDLSGANTATAQNGATTINAGNGTFTVPSSLFTNPGVTTFTITSITNVLTGCTTSGLGISDNFTIIPLPNASNATITVNNICLVDGVATVSITGATALTDGNYTIIYDLTVSNVSSANSIIVAFTSGSASFVIPSSLLTNAGNTTITIQDLITNTTFCGTSTLAINPITFVITDEATPTITTDGNIFCIQDNPTIADLTANVSPAGTITWYDAATGGTAYTGSEALINGNTYYASITIGTGCESSERLEVTVDLTSGCDELFIPDGFSPNNDGLNDEYFIKNINDLFPNFKLEIFNRYGNMVYTGGINTPNFTGKSNQSTFIGKEILPSGVYFYILYFNDATNKQPVQGRLYLSR